MEATIERTQRTSCDTEPKKRKIILSGELAKLYGRVHYLAVNSPAEAIRALSANFKTFSNFVSASEQRNVGYKVIIDDDQMYDTERLGHPFSKTMHIVPVIGGAKSGFFGIVIGAVLIAAAIFVPGLQFLLPVGISMVLGGVSSLLAPQPKSQAGDAEVTNQPSYVFNGPANTTAQGGPVPVGYGRMIVGSAVISAGISADDYDGSSMA